MYNKAALMLRCSKKRHLTLPGLLEPAFFFGAGWQIHRNKVQRPEETAQCRNESIAARRSPATVKREDGSALGLPMLPQHHLAHSGGFSFPNFTSKALTPSHLRFFLNLRTRPSLSNPPDTCSQINFSKGKLGLCHFYAKKPLRTIYTQKIKSKCLDSHSRPSVFYFQTSFIFNSPITHLLSLRSSQSAILQTWPIFLAL